MKYKFLPHTADAKFRSFGKNLEEQFSNAALAMTSIMIDPKKVKPKIKKQIKVKGKDIKNLLYNFLEELLYLLDTKLFILNKVNVKIKDNQLTATLVGDKASNYKTKGDVKAVTYQQMEIKKDYIQVIVDI